MARPLTLDPDRLFPADPRTREIEQALAGREARGEGVVAVGDQAARQLEPGRAQRILEALAAFAGGSEAVRPEDEAYPLMPDPDEVAHGL